MSRTANRLTQATIALIEGEGATAVTLDEVQAHLERGYGGSALAPERLLAELDAGGDSIRLVPHPRRRWAKTIGPHAWILVPRMTTESGGGPGVLLSRLRASLLLIGMRMDTGSTRAWARWTRMLEEEREVRRLLRLR